MQDIYWGNICGLKGGLEKVKAHRHLGSFVHLLPIKGGSRRIGRLVANTAVGSEGKLLGPSVTLPTAGHLSRRLMASTPSSLEKFHWSPQRM